MGLRDQVLPAGGLHHNPAAPGDTKRLLIKQRLLLTTADLLRFSEPKLQPDAGGAWKRGCCEAI